EAERRGGPNGKRARVLAALCLGAGNSWRPDGLLLGRTSCCVELGLRVSGDDREPAQPSREPRATRLFTTPWVAKIWREETMNGFMKKMVLVGMLGAAPFAFAQSSGSTTTGSGSTSDQTPGSGSAGSGSTTSPGSTGSTTSPGTTGSGSSYGGSGSAGSGSSYGGSGSSGS